MQEVLGCLEVPQFSFEKLDDGAITPEVRVIRLIIGALTPQSVQLLGYHPNLFGNGIGRPLFARHPQQTALLFERADEGL